MAGGSITVTLNVADIAMALRRVADELEGKATGGGKVKEGFTTKRARHIIPGIVDDAQRLGVSRYHLWAVLNGHRQSEGLVERYRALKEEV